MRRHTTTDVWTAATKLMKLMGYDGVWNLHPGNSSYSLHWALEVNHGSTFQLGYTKGEAVRSLNRMREGAWLQQDYGSI